MNVMMNNRWRFLLWVAFLLSGPVFAGSSLTIDDSSLSSTEPEGIFEVMAYGRFVPEREDDFAWENDRVAFRVYGPSTSAKGPASGVDAWFKKVSYPIVDKWYREHLAGKSYHQDQGEGYDVFHTGTSRGIGGSAIWLDGEAYPAGPFSDYEILASGGKKVAFQLTYQWDTPLGAITEYKSISLALAEQLYRVESIFLLNGEPASLPIAIGLTTHDGSAAVYESLKSGRISTWDDIDGHDYGGGVTALSEPVSRIYQQKSERKDASHVWLISASDKRGQLSYSAGFVWAEAGFIHNVEAWNAYLDRYSAEGSGQ